MRLPICIAAAAALDGDRTAAILAKRCAVLATEPPPTEWDGVPVYEAFGLPVERQSVQCER